MHLRATHDVRCKGGSGLAARSEGVAKVCRCRGLISRLPRDCFSAGHSLIALPPTYHFTRLACRILNPRATVAPWGDGMA